MRWKFGTVDMRFLLGIIVGVFLTIGTAYLSDASMIRTSDSATQSSADQQPKVNWDVVSRNWQGPMGGRASNLGQDGIALTAFQFKRITR
jgi:hypothetical protein